MPLKNDLIAGELGAEWLVEFAPNGEGGRAVQALARAPNVPENARKIIIIKFKKKNIL
jgi:hypothetical protein